MADLGQILQVGPAREDLLTHSEVRVLLSIVVKPLHALQLVRLINGILHL